MARPPRQLKCDICPDTFTAASPTQKYCPRCSKLAHSKGKAELYRRYMTEGRKCGYCGKHFYPEVPDYPYCSDRCADRRKENVAKCNERNRKNTPEPQEYKPRPKYKSPISNREQEQLNIEVRKKISPPFDPGRKLSKEEIQKVMPEITPIGKIPHRSKPTYTYGAAFGGER